MATQNKSVPYCIDSIIKQFFPLYVGDVTVPQSCFPDIPVLRAGTQKHTSLQHFSPGIGKMQEIHKLKKENHF